MAIFGTLWYHGTRLFLVQVAEFQPPDTAKNYFTDPFQAFYTRSRSIYSKAFIYLKSQKTVKELICYEVARSREAGAYLHVNEKNSFTHPSSCILPSFSQNTSELLLPKRLWKFESTISFWKCKWKVVLLVIYLFNYDSSKSIFFMLNYGITFSWGFSWVQFLSNKLEFFVSCNNIKSYKAII